MLARVISLGDAKAYVESGLVTTTTLEVSLGDALGCAVAEDVVAREQVPGFRNSSMDGFALRAADTRSGGAQLRIIDSVMAGHVSSLRLEPGEAMRIMTGAPLPEGADCVCKVEEVVIAHDEVTISRRIEPGECVREPGDDVRVGQLLLGAHTELTAPALAVLAGQGYSTVAVHRRPVVGVISTGDELALANDPLAPGQIRDLNRPLLMALLATSGVSAVDLGVVADDYDQILAVMGAAASRYDAVISTGGVSVGDVDHVKNVIAQLSQGRARSMHVAIKPAKPFAFGLVGSTPTPVFGLPGNPVSTRVSFEALVRPALRILAGHRLRERLRIRGILDIELPTPDDDKTHFVHVRAVVRDDGRIHVRDSARHQSHLLSAIVASNALAILEPENSYSRGDEVELMVVDADSLVEG